MSYIAMTSLYISAMSLKPTFMLTKAEKNHFSTELCMFCQEKIMVSKKVNKRHKTLNAFSQDFQMYWNY